MECFSTSWYFLVFHDNLKHISVISVGTEENCRGDLLPEESESLAKRVMAGVGGGYGQQWRPLDCQ